MRAAIFVGQDQDLSVEDVKPIEPGPKDVVVRVDASGVCHSDLSVINGTLPMPQALKVGVVGGPLGALGGSAAPTLLKTWATPLANEAIQLQFRQSVAANDALLVVDYSKRVTLTLSATTP